MYEGCEGPQILASSPINHKRLDLTLLHKDAVFNTTLQLPPLIAADFDRIGGIVIFVSLVVSPPSKRLVCDVIEALL